MRWQDYLILLVLVTAYLIYRLRSRSKAGPRRRQSRLTRREEAVLTRLKAQGYRLEEIHPGTPVTLLVENKSRRFNYRGVFIVKKLGKNYLVKLKRGDATPLSSAGLRQEMLLDYLFFQLDGILYYDLEKDKFQELSFKFEGRGSSSEQRLLRGAIIALIGIGAVLLYYFL
ncbi:MAG: hypothetical protein GX973_00340 [Firmicutes bacterium]|nr:hypothetical protein [Bacillota bacterium]